MKKSSVFGRVFNGFLKTNGRIRWRLLVYDMIVFVLIFSGMVFLHPSVEDGYGWRMIIEQTILGSVLFLVFRLLFGCYRHIIRYGGYEAYLSLIAADACAFIADYLLDRFTPIPYILFTLMLSIFCINLLVDIMLRMIYATLYRIVVQSRDAELVSFAARILRIFGYEIAEYWQTLQRKLRNWN